MELSKLHLDYLFSNKDAVIEICQPLFQNTKITFFDYEYYERKGGYFTLTTHPEFRHSYLTHHLYPTLQEFERHRIVNSNKKNKNTMNYAFMSEAMMLPQGAADLNAQKYIKNILEAKAFQIYHRIYFIQHEESFFKVIGFGVSENEKSIFEFYLNSIDFLERFGHYFEFQAYDIIAQGKNSLLELPGFLTPASTSNIPDPVHKSLPFLFPSQYQIKFNNHPIKFTKREMECFVLKIKGNTAKEIGRFLNISHRTVEKTLLNIYEKIPRISKRELISTFEEQGIFKLFEGYCCSKEILK